MRTLPCAFLILSTFALQSFASITVSSPANASEVSSPFALSANAPNCSSQNVAAMGYSLDDSTDTTIVNSTSVQALVTAAPGTHTLHVKAWGDHGAVCVSDIPVTIASLSSSPVVPSDAISVSGIQTLSNWQGVNDSGSGSGMSIGSTAITNSPSQSGHTRQFATTYADSGAERYFVSFGDDTEATNFLYDAWVYLNGSSSQIANLEMDMNQVMPNGQTVIFGVQCDGYSGTWDYTTNAGTPASPSDRWLHSKASCNVRNWTINSWHHVQISYSRDNSGNVTYKSVWVDNDRQDLNATVPSAFALGWAPALLTNFQVDGLGAKGSPVIYLDNLRVYRW
ncbi:hypothetical protein H7849_15790 [Alloacidobacterium dinghuense]|uniref:Uncharacterized protein n=1 Tax=Alloacidobacterium dinghuense TaxID=2763107 RepID=A0A7G8BDH6_9BACT|nr:hypothetical protein [Alloacidobacterium dinghuense]QNI30596.1 hypothetical protein H7849_15790 [Alloacidobacterium dinghuense]